MGTILTNFGEYSMIASWLSGRSTVDAPGGTDEIIPTATTGEWGVGLGQNGPELGDTPLGTGTAAKSKGIADIVEIGQATPAGYERQPIDRSNGAEGWPDPTIVSTSYQTTYTPEAVFGPFTGTPNANDAGMWFVAGSTVAGEDNVLFGADLAVVRTFTEGSVERVIPTFRVV